jgi:hypothetical protein
MIPYRDIKRDKVELPPRSKRGMGGYVRPPMTQQTFVPQYYQPAKEDK